MPNTLLVFTFFYQNIIFYCEGHVTSIQDSLTLYIQVLDSYLNASFVPFSYVTY